MPSPVRGQIWFVKLDTDPPGKGLRPMIVVSEDIRNRHERVDTVLCVPLTTSVHKGLSSRILLPAGETGLSADSAARAEDITTIKKHNLVAPRYGLRQISHTRICQIGRAVQIAIGCSAEAI
jgi:mRNA-degrading endonuclease toxin of MazEF toxin-antitoxin module